MFFLCSCVMFRTKLKQTEVDCEYLRRFCETLTEENGKLQKEVQQLRVLKVSPDQTSLMHGNQHPPPTTLTMCPSCKSVSLSSSSSSTSSAAAKSPTEEMCQYPVAVFHQQQFPLCLKKLSLTINNNRMFESHLPHA